MNDYEKYLKYKSKYIELKNKGQRGGALNSFPIMDEIHFWARQMMEHALFLHLGLEDDKGELKNRAFELHQKWKNFLDTYFYDKGIKVTPETVQLTPADLSLIGDVGVPNDKTNALIKESIDFTNNIIQILESGKWIGWVYISLAKHMLEETEYFKRKVNGPAFTVEEEIAFSNHHHSGELGVTAQLIDPEPEQQAIIDIVRSYALKKMSVLRATGGLAGLDAAQSFPKEWTAEQEAILSGLNPSDETNMLMLAIKFGEEVSEFADDTGKKIENNSLASVISPVLAHHVHREFVRLTETLKKQKQ